MIQLDLNADLGEGLGDDDALLEIVSSASIACGGHAGDETSMSGALHAAKARGVVVGYHPGFADQENFGRLRLDLSADELTTQLREQFDTLQELASEAGVTLRYVKLHGALANMAAQDPEIARTAFVAAKSHDPALAVLAIDNSAQIEAALALDMEVVREAYADRAYLGNGLLVARTAPGAVLHDPRAIAERAIRLAERGEIVAIDGTVIATRATSFCLHGDTVGALAVARHLHIALAQAGISISATL